MKEEEIPDLNIFMMCEQLNERACKELPKDFYFRNCSPQDLETWKAFPFDSDILPEEHRDFMDDFVERVYGNQMDLFYKNTLLVCNSEHQPVATCSHWKAYGKFNSIHWLKTIKAYEGKGLGRALLTAVMRSVPASGYPLYLHTQPGSFRAIKLYSDFGFKLLKGQAVGNRTNDIEDCMPILKEFIPSGDFANLQITETPAGFIEDLKNETSIEF
jgi:GNAT superfamily N-acetyltransferase